LAKRQNVPQNPGKFAIHHAESTLLFRLNSSRKIKSNQSQSKSIKANQSKKKFLFMTRNGRKQPRRAVASAHPLAKPLEGHNGTVVGRAVLLRRPGIQGRAAALPYHESEENCRAPEAKMRVECFNLQP
jgi:hypothetical protein